MNSSIKGHKFEKLHRNIRNGRNSRFAFNKNTCTSYELKPLSMLHRICTHNWGRLKNSSIKALICFSQVERCRTPVRVTPLEWLWLEAANRGIKRSTPDKEPEIRMEELMNTNSSTRCYSQGLITNLLSLVRVQAYTPLLASYVLAQTAVVS